MTLEIDATAQEEAEIERIKAACVQSAREGLTPEELQNLLGGALAGKGFGDAAIACFEAAAGINPFNVAALNNIGNVLLERGEVEAAIKRYRAALKINPDFAEAYSNLGNAQQQIGAADSAIMNYRLALSINPDSAVVHNNLGNALRLRGMPEVALESYQTAVALSSDYAEAHLNMGIVLKETGALDAAMACFETAIRLDPEDADAHSQLAHTYRIDGNTDAAITHFNKTLEINPDNALDRHILAALNGETPAKAPRAYVEPLFDQYAAGFEHALVSELAYKTPKLLADLMTGSQSASSLGAVLDLGCGTGLAGVELRAHCQHLVGIDLSNAMLEQAREKGIYDQLTHTEITGFLASEPLDFDIIVATDVLIYFGDLSDIFRLIKSRNQRGGKLVFSTEHSETGDFVLHPTGRYAHSKPYIETLCRKYDYTLVHFSTADLRKEKGAFLTGGLYMLEF